VPATAGRQLPQLAASWLLGFHLQLGVLGLWIALTICTALQAAAFGVLISRFDYGYRLQK
jgi:Na+-driven multidrug efflux pump